MWQSTFVLQTCAAHLNYIQGRVPVPALNSEDQLFRTALSLSAVAVIVCRILFIYCTDLKSGQAHSSSPVDWRNDLRS